MTEQNQQSGGSSQRQEQAAEHADTEFRQLGGEDVVDPGATDTSIGGTTGTDGGFVGEDEPRASDG